MGQLSKRHVGYEGARDGGGLKTNREFLVITVVESVGRPNKGGAM